MTVRTRSEATIDVATHALTPNDHGITNGDGLGRTWDCTCGASFSALDVDWAFQHGQETGDDFGRIIPAAREAIGSTVVGAVIDRWADFRGVDDEDALDLITHLASDEGADELNRLLDLTYNWVYDLEGVCEL